MNRLRFPLLAAACLIVPATAVWAAPVPATRTGLEQVPATAPFVVHLRGVQGTRDRFVAMMQNALPDVLKKFQNDMDDFLKNGRDGRKLRGLAKDGPIFLVVTELPKADGPFPDPPPFALVLTVTDYKKFRDNILSEDERKSIKDAGDGIESVVIKNESSPTYFLDRKGYAVVTPNEDVAKKFTKKFTGLHTKMSKEQAAKFLGSDLGLYLNMESVNATYAEQIKEAKDAIDEALGPLEGGGDEAQKKSIQMVKKIIGPVFQAVEDMSGVLVSVEFRPGGLGLHVQSEMKESSPTANLLQDSRPVAFKELERLPAGQAIYVAMKESAALLKGLGSFLVGIPLGKGGEQSKEISAVLNDLAKAGPTVQVQSLVFPMKGLKVSYFDDPAKAVAAYLKAYKAMAGDLKTFDLKKKPEIKIDAHKHGGFTLHEVQIAYDFDKMAEPVAQKGGDDAKKQLSEAMKSILGEKTNVWFGTDGKSVVEINAPDWESARKMLDQYSKGAQTAGEAKAFQKLRKEMPKQTSFLGLIDATHVFGTILKMVKPMLPPVVALPPGWPNMPAEGVSAYVGLAVTLQPRRGSLDLFITAAAAQEFYKAVVQPLLGE